MSALPSASPSRRRLWRRAALTGLAAGSAVGALMLHIAWDHNPDGEFHEAGQILWAAWLPIGGLWALAVAVPVTLIAFVVLRAAAADAARPGSPPRAG